MVCRSFARRVRIEQGIPEPDVAADLDDDTDGVFERMSEAAAQGRGVTVEAIGASKDSTFVPPPSVWAERDD